MRKNLEQWKEELLNKHFGRLTIIDVVPYIDSKTGNKKGYQAICQCSCGNVKEVIVNSLINGLTQSCGCLRKEIGKELGNNLIQWRKEHPEESKQIENCNIQTLLEWRKEHKDVFLDIVKRSKHKGGQKEYIFEKHKNTLINKQFEKLTILDIKHRVTKDGYGDGYDALCKCFCGKKVVVSLSHLFSGSVKSCGCFKGNFIKPKLKQSLLDRLSKEEKELYDYLISLGYTPERQFMLENHYFDFRISNFLIEYHGSVYHCTKFENKENKNSKLPIVSFKTIELHKNLRDLAIKNNYHLIQVWDYDWVHKKEFVQRLLKDQLSGIANYKYYLNEDNLLNNDYGFIIDGEQVEPKPLWISTGYRQVVNEEYQKGKVLVYNSGYTKIIEE